VRVAQEMDLGTSGPSASRALIRMASTLTAMAMGANNDLPLPALHSLGAV
jgi:hypothetical protein